MRTHEFLAALGFVVLLAGVGKADKVTCEYDHSIRFSNYKTFMWTHAPESDEPSITQSIMNSVNAQLQIRGMRRVSESADLVIDVNLATREEHTWEDYYDGTRWGWDPGVGGKGPDIRGTKFDCRPFRRGKPQTRLAKRGYRYCFPEGRQAQPGD